MKRPFALSLVAASLFAGMLAGFPRPAHSARISVPKKTRAQPQTTPVEIPEKRYFSVHPELDNRTPPNTGIQFVAPKGMTNLPVYRIAKPDDTAPPGLPPGWSSFAEDMAEEASLTAATKESVMTVGTPGGSFVVSFSVPVAELNPLEYTAPMVWTQTVQVRKGRMTRLEIKPPPLDATNVAHVTLKMEKTMYPFNDLLIETAEPSRQRNALTSRWEFYASSGWPEDIKIALLKGSYRLFLSRSTLGAFSGYRYESPILLNVTGDNELALTLPKICRLQANITDRNGHPMSGVPVFFKGSGQSYFMFDSGDGLLDHKLPVGHYEVRAMVFDGDKQREIVLMKDLDLAQDQTVTWKTPVTMFDFGLGASSKK